MKNKKREFFWVVTPYILEKVRRFGGTHHHLHGRRVVPARNEQESGCQQKFESEDDIHVFLRHAGNFPSHMAVRTRRICSSYYRCKNLKFNKKI
jgi:hypothetical protein